MQSQWRGRFRIPVPPSSGLLYKVSGRWLVVSCCLFVMGLGLGLVLGVVFQTGSPQALVGPAVPGSDV